MKYETYLAKVNSEILNLTDGVVDVSDLPDVVDIGEHYADDIPPRVVAAQILAESGGEALLDEGDLEMMEAILGYGL